MDSENEEAIHLHYKPQSDVLIGHSGLKVSKSTQGPASITRCINAIAPACCFEETTLLMDFVPPRVIFFFHRTTTFWIQVFFSACIYSSKRWQHQQLTNTMLNSTSAFSRMTTEVLEVSPTSFKMLCLFIP